MENCPGGTVSFEMNVGVESRVLDPGGVQPLMPAAEFPFCGLMSWLKLGLNGTI